MARFFSSSPAGFVRQWFGLSRDALPPTWKAAVENFTKPGGSAEAKFGPIESVEIGHRDGVAVHTSSYNPADKEPCVQIRVVGANDTKTCHVFEDGTGTARKDGERD